MDTELIGAVVTGVLSSVGALAGVLIAGRQVVAGQRRDLVRACSDKVHNGNDEESRLAYNHLNGLLRGKKLNAEQRQWAKTAVRSYLAGRFTE